jgi:hypothetical protein
MRILDAGKATIVEFDSKLSKEEKDVLNNYLLLFKSHLQEKEISDEIEKLAGDLKKGRWERYLKSRKHEPVNS